MKMLEIHLGYGKEGKVLHIPEANLAGIIKPAPPKQRLAPAKALASALDDPLEGQRLQDLATGKRVCVTIEDYTRSEPHKEIVTALSERLTTASMVQFIVATGTHNPGDTRNVKLTEMITNVATSFDLNFDVDINSSRDAARFEYAGTTSRKTPVYANKKATDADIFVAAADMKPHYFAGYSAANKHFLPGICAFESVRANHCGLIKKEESNYGRHPRHYDKKRQDKPLAADMVEAMELILHGRPAYALAMINDGDILWTRFGQIEPVTREGIKRADEVYTFTVRPVRHMIVSPGGYPYDAYLYSGQRAPELCLEAVQQSGEVLWISQCADGIHTGANQQIVQDFYDAMKSDLHTLAARLDDPDVKFHTYKAYRFRRMLEKIAIYGYSNLGDEILRSIDIKPVAEPQDIIDMWLGDDPNDKILVVDKANKLAVYGADEEAD